MSHGSRNNPGEAEKRDIVTRETVEPEEAVLEMFLSADCVPGTVLQGGQWVRSVVDRHSSQRCIHVLISGTSMLPYLEEGSLQMW